MDHIEGVRPRAAQTATDVPAPLELLGLHSGVAKVSGDRYREAAGFPHGTTTGERLTEAPPEARQ